jgi:hypothetical protein
LPKAQRNRKWIDIELVPPGALVANAMKLAMVNAA